MKIKEYIIHAEDDFFGECLHVVVHNDLNQVKEYIENKYKEPDLEIPVEDWSGAFFTLEFAKERHNYIWMERKDYGILAHELLHFVFHVIHKAGITYSEESEETYTYYIQHKFDAVRRAFNNKGK